MRRLLSLLLVLALCVVPSLAESSDPLPAPPDLSGVEAKFPQVLDYPGYPDVKEQDWFAGAARACYETGLITGTPEGFSPDGGLDLSQLAAVAARMNEAITGEEIPAPVPNPALPWYQHYVDYLAEAGIPVSNPERAATRADFVSLLAAVVSPELTPALNQITALPDTEDTEVLRFYNAGILTGVDKWGTFDGEGFLTRAEAAAMAARIVRPALRLSFSPADYSMFEAAGLAPADALFASDRRVVTAGEYLPCVTGLIGELDALCANEGMEFNWFNTYGEQTFLDYVTSQAMARLGVTRDMGTPLYEQFDVQVFYSKLLDGQAQSST